MDSTNQFFIIETTTDHRKKAKDDYIICINHHKKGQLSIGKFAVITHEITYEKKKKLKYTAELLSMMI